MYGQSASHFGVEGDVSNSSSAGVGGINESTGPDVYGRSNGGYAGYFDGKVAATGYDTSSDARFKNHIATLPNALDKIIALRGVTFDWKQKEFPEMRFDGGKHIGFLAQEVKKVLPEVVSKDKKGYLSVDYTKVVPVLVEAIKEQQKEIARRLGIKESTVNVHFRHIYKKLGVQRPMQAVARAISTGYARPQRRASNAVP